MGILSPRHLVMVLLFSTANTFVRTAHTQHNPSPAIKVRFYDHAGVGAQSLQKAQRQVSLIFRRIGVEVEWVQDAEPQFRILIVEQMPREVASKGDVFGDAPRDADGTSSGIAYVAYGLIRAFVQNPEPGRPRLTVADMLSYCIAHEIGHLLLPARSHSPTGIMRARWRSTDFTLIATDTLRFTPEQAKRIKDEALRLTLQH
jgi:hypothetical protein